MKKTKKQIIPTEKAVLLNYADDLLSEISFREDCIKGHTVVMGQKIEEITKDFETQIAGATEDLKCLEKDLVALMKKNSGLIFDGEERVEVEHGSLLFTIEERVRKAKWVLENLKEHGFTEAVKVVESVDWDALDKWSKEKLALVGTERKRKEVFSWEIKEEGKSASLEERNCK